MGWVIPTEAAASGPQFPKAVADEVAAVYNYTYIPLLYNGFGLAYAGYNQPMSCYDNTGTLAWTLNLTDLNAVVDTWVAMSLNENEDELWVLGSDTGVSPNRFYLAKKNVQNGTLTNIGNDIPSSGLMNGCQLGITAATWDWTGNTVKLFGGSSGWYNMTISLTNGQVTVDPSSVTSLGASLIKANGNHIYISEDETSIIDIAQFTVVDTTTSGGNIHLEMTTAERGEFAVTLPCPAQGTAQPSLATNSALYFAQWGNGKVASFYGTGGIVRNGGALYLRTDFDTWLKQITGAI